MKARRIVAGLSATLLALSAMSITAFAEEIEFEDTDSTEVFSADAALEDVDTEEIDDLDETGDDDFDIDEVDDTLGDDDVVDDDVVDGDDDDATVFDGDAEDTTTDAKGDEKESAKEEAKEETKSDTFKASYEGSELLKITPDGSEGHSQYYIPLEKVKDFPSDKDIKVTVQYKTADKYVSSKEVEDAAHKVMNADLVFILDTTGSMGEEISGVKKNIETFVNALKDKGVNLKMAVVEYKDTYYGQNSTLCDFDGAKWTSDPQKVFDMLNSFSITGGGSNKGESLLDAFNVLDTGSPDWYNDDADKFVFVLTDETYREESPLTYAQWVDKFSTNDVKVSVVTSKYLETDYKELAEKTGGKMIDINSSDYGALMTDFASYVEKTVVNSVRYANWNIKPVDDKDDSTVKVDKATNASGAVEVAQESSSVEFTMPARYAAELFSENGEHAGYSNLLFDSFGINMTNITFEAVGAAKAEPEKTKCTPDAVVYPPLVTPQVGNPDPNPVERAKVSPYVAALPAETTTSSTASPIAATGGVFDEGSNAPMAAAGVVGALAVVCAGVLVVLNKKKRQH